MNVIDQARRSIRFRLWILLVAMSMVILALSTIIFGVYGWTLQRRQSEEQLVAIANLVALNSSAALAFDDAETAGQDLLRVKKNGDILYAGILDAGGKIFAEHGTCTSPFRINEENPARTIVVYHGNSRMCVVTPIWLENEILGYVRLEQDLSNMNRQVITLATGTLMVFFFTLLVAIFLTARIGRTITGPITHLASMVRQVSVSRRIGSPDFVTSKDEIGDLARGINVMLDNLEISRHELEKSLSLQQTLFDTIPMPVYGKNIGRKFTAMNQMFATEVIGQKPENIINRMQEDYPEIFNAELLATFRKFEIELLVSGQQDPFEITIRDQSGHQKIYLIQLGLYRDAAGSTAGLMGVMQDITEIRRIGKELIDVSMREQQRLARDLHDNLGQLLTATACKIKTIDCGVTDEQTELKTSLAEVIGLINRAARESRALSHGLNPVDIERGGLIRALKELATSTEIYTRLACRLNITGELPDIDKDVSNQLYRIAQEAVSNAARHASATAINIHLAREKDHVILVVSDDGSGLPTTHDHTAAGMGLRIMTQRALMIHGELIYRTRKEGGTEVICRSPIQQKEA